MTLGVLAPYRSYGVGSKLLNHVQTYAQQQNIQEIFLHVQTSNSDAIRFYQKFNFQIVGTIPNYYKRITPPDCYVLSRTLDSTDSSSASTPITSDHL